MSTAILTPGITSITGEYALPTSKSISNRLLIMQALSGCKVQVQGLSQADDANDLKRCLEEKGVVINAGSGGTTSRFLLAYLAIKEGEWVLDASAQMRQRSVKPLVDALLQLGADITYTENDGYLPVRIVGKALKSSTINIDAGTSSQFVSALMLIAPYIKDGLDINLTPGAVSQSYINMTRRLMQQCGAVVNTSGNNIRVEDKEYTNADITVEPDWSAAAFAYELAALSDNPEIHIPMLKPSMLQGDSIVADMFHYFKVKTTFDANGAQLIKGKERTPKQRINLKAYPDLAPALLITCAALGIEAEVWGIGHLKYKESNRIEALQVNLEKMGITVKADNDTLYTSGQITPGMYNIDSYSDHRIAMAFAPLVLKGCTLFINNSDCISKSFPMYWERLKTLGINISMAS